MRRTDTAPEPFWQNLKQDLWRHFVYVPDLGRGGKLLRVLTLDGIWAIAAYRLGRAVKTQRPKGARLWWAAYRALELGVRTFSGIRLDPDSRIGPGFYIGHFGPIFVGPDVEIGRNSSIGQMCFVSAADNAPDRAPVLGERVYLGAGAKVIGPVRIEEGVAVGANAVVLEDVPKDAVVVGNPARVVSYEGSGDFIYLGGPSQPRPDESLAPKVGPARHDGQAAGANTVAIPQNTLAGGPPAPAADPTGGGNVVVPRPPPRPAGEGGEPVEP